MSTSVEAVTGISHANASASFEKFFIHTPDSAAKVILKGVRKNARRVLVGNDAKFLDGMARVMPAGYQWVLTNAVRLQKRFAR